MSLPDIDYELRDMGQHEYAVGLSAASTPEDMRFVADAFRAGQEKEGQRILKALEQEARGYQNLYISLDKVRKIINND